MAPIAKTLALAGALFAVSGLAAPVDKRAVVTHWVTDVVWTTVDITTTIYPGQEHGGPTTTATAVTAPAAAPTTHTTEAAAAPQPTVLTSTVALVPQSTEKTAVAPAPQPTEKTTTVAPAPQPTQQTTTVAPAPQPTEHTTVPPPAPAPTSTTTAAPAPAPTASSSSSGSGGSGSSGACSDGSPCTGDLTYYDTATSPSAPSACGTTNDGLTQSVLALPVGIMTDADCGKTVTINYNGVTATGTVVDKCMGCDDSSIDLSQALFEQFASLSAGRLTGATWHIE